MPSEMPQLKIRLPEDLMERLRVMSEKSRRSLSSLAQEYIEDGLKHDAAMSDYYDQQERQQRAGLDSLTNDQFDALVDIINELRAKKPAAKKRR
jgi:predicted DNA-binding protein